MHVWQYEEDGIIYIPEALGAQDGGAGYEYAGEDTWSAKSTALQDASDAGKDLTDFNREQQGDIVEDYYKLRKEIVEFEAKAAGNFDADKRSYLEAFILFVADVSTLSKSQLQVPLPSVSESSDEDARWKTNDVLLGSPNVDAATLLPHHVANSSVDLAREAVFAQLSPVASVQSTAVTSILQSLDSGPTVGTNPASALATATPARAPSSNCEQGGQGFAGGRLKHFAAHHSCCRPGVWNARLASFA